MEAHRLNGNNMKNEIEKLDNAINQLKVLKREIQKKDKLSQKAFECNGTPRQREKVSADLNWQCMYLDKQRKDAWKAIVDANLEVSLEKQEYNPSGFHKY